jgi:molecular chaperone Hsp33
MREGLAASALHLASRPLDEMFGITINIKTPPLNLFVAGDAREAVLTGRAFTEGVKTTEVSRFFVQAHRQRGEPTQSTIDVEGLDVLGMFEDYYRRSEQTQARFFDLDEEHFLMVLALPDSDGEAVAELDRDAARALLDGEARLLDERTVVFRCGCNLDKVLKALRDIFGADPDELFQGEESVETFCPRCGSRWMVSRQEFETTDPEGA